MKTFILTLLATALVFGCSCNCVLAQSNDETFGSNKTKVVDLKVKGMTCQGCADHVNNALLKKEGVVKSDVRFAQRSASVMYDPAKTTEAEIIQTILKTGYTVEVAKESKTQKNGQSERIKIEDRGAVSFYAVPLVCNAAPTLGCGSRSKPVLLDLEKSETVKEAWLNRTGTVIGIVWKDNIDFKVRRDVIIETFTKHQVKASELLMDDYATNFASLSKREGWHRGSDVNVLSKEEAGIIAEQLMGPIKKKTELNFADEQKMRDKITDRLYDFFLNYESLDELGDPQVYKSMITDFIEYGETLVGKGNMPTADELWKACEGAAKSCDHEGCKGSSCSVPKN